MVWVRIRVRKHCTEGVAGKDARKVSTDSFERLSDNCSAAEEFANGLQEAGQPVEI